MGRLIWTFAVNLCIAPDKVLRGVILELSDREKFCDNFRISGRSFVQIFYFSIHFTSSSAQGREVSQLRETFSPKLPCRMTPGAFYN